MSTVRPCPDQAIDARQAAPYRRAYGSLRPSPVDVSTMRSAPRACLSPRVRRWAGDRSPRRTLLDLSGPTAGVRSLPSSRGGVAVQERASGGAYQHNDGGPTNEPHVEEVALAEGRQAWPIGSLAAGRKHPYPPRPPGRNTQERRLQNLSAPPDGRGTSKRRRIVTSIVIALIASSLHSGSSKASSDGRGWQRRTLQEELAAIPVLDGRRSSHGIRHPPSRPSCPARSFRACALR